MQLDRPVFIGGTGRSGTSIMANLLNSHADLCLPGHENKLIVEHGGLRDIVDSLSGRYDMARFHAVLQGFLLRAQRMQKFGFPVPELNLRLNQLTRYQKLNFQQAFEIVQRENPQVPGSIHAIGVRFGVEHYIACINAFLLRIVTHIAPDGIVTANGLLKPFYMARTFTRDTILAECRRFLDELYAPSLTAAGAARWIDDTPLNFVNFDFLHALYPQMKFIHMIRDPRDVAASFTNQAWFPPDQALAISVCAAMIRSYRSLKDSIPADRLLEVRLEDLVTKTDETLTRVAAFLEVENRFDTTLLSADKANLGRGKSVDAALTEAADRELGDWMRLQGYLE
ncbi:MAG: sulfotransferase [Alphaproteobacteria bacterium]|nr:sulfotransferase [Alphaproteobacteria bacterium]